MSANTLTNINNKACEVLLFNTFNLYAWSSVQPMSKTAKN